MWESFEDICNDFRNDLKLLERKARNLSEDLKKSEPVEWGNKWAQIAQSIIAIRHLEDARMRFWKVIQYLWDWVSKFDK